ncbi:MAG: hypothetical protein ABSG03_01915 [Bryobacteraceae bacterium]|jgi:hypothetical protein
MALADEIRTAFQPLIGLQWALARHSGITVFHFGEVRPAPGGGTVGQFALHIQCPWRVVTPDRIVTGSPDYWYPADESLDWDEWEKDRTTRRSSSAPPSLQEKRLLDLFCGYDPDTGACVNITERLVVEAVGADNYGGVQIEFSGDCSLQLFPASTCESSHGENWRLFEPGSDADHFVAMPNGALERVGQSSAGDTE